MKRRKLEPMGGGHVNVTPLIDVVMCLIIFFLVCGKLAKDEVEGGEIKVPLAKLGQDIPEQRDRLVINVVPYAGDLPAGLDAKKAEDRVRIADFIGSQPPTIYIRGKAVDKDQLTGLLKQEAAANKDLKVMIRADQVQHYEYISPVLIACVYANIRVVNFSTTALP